MRLRRALAHRRYFAARRGRPAAAQFQPQPRAQQQQPPCMQEFLKLRADAEKKAAAIKLASEHKATPKEACHLFTAFAAAEVKLIKFAAESGVWCGMPAQVLAQMKQSHAQTDKLRARICQAAAAPPRPAGPTLERRAGRARSRRQQHQDRQAAPTTR